MCDRVFRRQPNNKYSETTNLIVKMNQDAASPLTIGQSISKCKDDIRSILRRLKETFEPCSQKTVEAFTANLIEDLNSVFDEFLAKASPKQNDQSTAVVGENDGNDSDAIIDLDSESDDEINVKMENEKNERVGPPVIANTIISNDNVKFINPEPVTLSEGMDTIPPPRIVIDETEVIPQLNKLPVQRRKQIKWKSKQPRPKNIACEICKKKFRDTHSLIYHRRCHLNRFSIYCKICIKFFSNSDEKVDHEMFCTKRRYECYACKLIMSRNNLTQHMGIHSGEKLFKCKHCIKRFRYNSSLRVHMKTQH